MLKTKQKIIVFVLLILFSITCFFYWNDQQAIKALNEGLPEGIRIEKELIGNYKITNEINNYTFEAPGIWKGIEEIKYLTERESLGYKFTSINIKGKTPESGVIAVVKFESKPDVDLMTQADLFFKAFELERSFTESKVKNIDTIISKNNPDLMGIDASFFQKDNYTYLITCGSEDFIEEVILNGTW